jgi:hypothetical protein
MKERVMVSGFNNNPVELNIIEHVCVNKKAQRKIRVRFPIYAQYWQGGFLVAVHDFSKMIVAILAGFTIQSR